MADTSIDPTRIFYVYMLLRADGSPCYVGKGHGRRHRHHLGRSHNRHVERIVAEDGRRNIQVKTIANLTEAESFELEALMIADIGRIPHGPLVNLVDGGLGVRNPSSETRDRMRAAKLGIPQSLEHIEKRVAPRRGKPRSLMVREKIAATLTGVKHTDERRENGRAANRSGDPEVRAKISATVKEQMQDPARRALIAESNRRRARK